MSNQQLSRRHYAIMVIAVFVSLAVGFLLGRDQSQPKVIHTPFRLGENITLSHPDGPEFMQPDPNRGGEMRPVQPTKQVKLRIDRVGEQMKLDPTRRRIWSFRVEHDNGTSSVITATED